MTTVNGIGGIGKAGADMEAIQPIGINKKKKFPDELSASLSGTPINVAYMPSGGIGSLLNGKGSSQAATQV